MSKVVPLKAKPKAALPQEAYKPTPVEQKALNAYSERCRAAKPCPRLRIKDNYVDIDHVDQAIGGSMLMEALGTAHVDFGHAILGDITNIATKGPKIDEQSSNEVLSAVAAIEPRDAVETMLALQMTAVHRATMTMARRLAHVETLPQQDSAERAFNKLARTFAAQVEALKRYRSKGEQRVYVERVNVAEGGQAIVGNVETGGRG